MNLSDRPGERTNTALLGGLLPGFLTSRMKGDVNQVGKKKKQKTTTQRILGRIAPIKQGGTLQHERWGNHSYLF